MVWIDIIYGLFVLGIIGFVVIWEGKKINYYKDFLNLIFLITGIGWLLILPYDYLVHQGNYVLWLVNYNGYLPLEYVSNAVLLYIVSIQIVAVAFLLIGGIFYGLHQIVLSIKSTKRSIVLYEVLIFMVLPICVISLMLALR